MTHFIFPAFFGLACGFALYRAWRIGDPRRVMMAFIMVAIWAASNVLWLYNMVWLFPILDALAGTLAVLMWVERADKWLLGLWLAFGLRLLGHVTAAIAEPEDITAYLHFNNALFALALWVIGREKGKRNDGGNLLHWLRKLRMLGRHASPPARGGMSRGF